MARLPSREQIAAEPAVPAPKDPLALVAIGASTPVLARFNPDDDTGRWRFQMP